MRERIFRIICYTSYYLLLIIAVFTFIFPFIWMGLSALKPIDEIFQYPPILFSRNLTIQNFVEVFRAVPFARYMWNSFFVASTVTIVSLLLHSMAGFALARLNVPGRKIIFLVIISTMMIPFYTIMIPLLLIVKAFGWINTYWALIVPEIFQALGIFWLRQFFLGMPSELEEAARIDGASWITVFFRIALPMARPVLATLAVLFFLFNWDAFLWPLLVTSSQDMRVVQVGVQAFAGGRNSAWNLIMAASTIAILPTLILFFSLQRFIVSSVKMSGMKG